MKCDLAKGNPEFRPRARLARQCVLAACKPIDEDIRSRARLTPGCRQAPQRTLIHTAAMRCQRGEPAKQQQRPDLWHVFAA